ncbi:hypothetical protein HpMS158_12590 [Helicobacter pylori]
MWSKRFFKVFPAMVFLFCFLEIFELVLIIIDLNKTEKLENKIDNDLQTIEKITNLSDKHLECMHLENFKYKKIK